MNDIVVRAERLGKKYLIGHHAKRERYTALRDVLARGVRTFARASHAVLQGRQLIVGDNVEEFWALKDVSFEVRRGEVVGIIGRNGAGKSTLLKILSRITEPTAGKVTIRGRVSSLIEVGTGFHPELSGRENVFLNGSILGMNRREIERKFDEIVDFAGIEKFIDTPVKRYSSGMYVRLAFAIAAHLEPEILVVDEVLAVGDGEFQQKCAGKLEQLSRRGGRTILFVSHNMEAIFKLCSCAILIDRGEIALAGNVPDVVAAYVDRKLPSLKTISLTDKPRSEGFSGRARLTKAISLADSWSFPFGNRLAFMLWIHSQSTLADIELGVGLFSQRGFEVASWTNTCAAQILSLETGVNIFSIDFGDMMLLPGQYSFGIGLRVNERFEDYVPDAIPFEVVPSKKSAAINANTFGGALVPTAAVVRLPPTSP